MATIAPVMPSGVRQAWGIRLRNRARKPPVRIGSVVIAVLIAPPLESVGSAHATLTRGSITP